MEGMNESYNHSSFFIATDFQIPHTLKLVWDLSSCMFLLHFWFYKFPMAYDQWIFGVSGRSGPKSILPHLKLNTFELKYKCLSFQNVFDQF
jgi:hypothetical protein